MSNIEKQFEQLIETILSEINSESNTKPLDLIHYTEINEDIVYNIYKEEIKRESAEITADEFFDSTILDLQYKDTSIFSEQFLNLFKKELGTAANFNAMSKKEQQALYQNLVSLMEIEYSWKTLTKKINYQHYYIFKMFYNELLKFRDLMTNNFISQKNNNQHINKKYTKSKLINFYENFMEFCISNHVNFLPDNYVFDKKDIDKIIQKINYDAIFYDLIKICMKKATDSLFNKSYSDFQISSEEILANQFLRVKRTDIMYSYQNIFVMYLINLWVEEFYVTIVKPTGNEVDLTEMNKYIDVFIHDNRSKYIQKDWYLKTFDVVMLIIDLFKESGVIIDEFVLRRQGDIKEYKVYVLPHKISYSIPISSHIPPIVKPDQFKNNEDVMKVTAEIAQGYTHVQYSKNALIAFNLSHSKKFRINTLYKIILSELLNTSGKPWNNCFTEKQLSVISKTNYNIFLDEFETNCLQKNGLNAFQRFISSRVLLHLKTQQKDNKNTDNKYTIYNLRNSICDISQVELTANKQVYLYLKKMREYKNDRQLLLTSLTLADVLEDFPIFYSTKLDFRTRMYPWQYLISRTSGSYKHLLTDFKSIPITLSGLKNIFKAYFVIDEKISDEFNKFLEKNKNISLDKFFKEVKIFFDRNPVYLFKKNIKLPYFIMLYCQIQQIITYGLKTRIFVNLEIDQNASGVVFMALLLRNKHLAEKCNLLQPEKQDIYTYVNENIADFILKKRIKKNILNNNLDENSITKEEFIVDEENSYTFLKFFENRKATKYALMCFCYNQQHKARTTEWKNLWIETLKRSPNSEEYAMLNFLSINYAEFLDSLFPNMVSQMNKLNNALRYALKKGYKPKIKTLDGCLITWDYFKTDSRKRSYYNPVTKEHHSYKINALSYDDDENPISKTSQHLISFLPHLIHSIDAAIMRNYLVKMKEKNNYIINHLHDCVIVHPNFIESFYNIVLDTFTDKKMLTLAEDLFFDTLKNNVDIDTAFEIENYKKEYLSYCDDFEIKKEIFNPKNMYSFEN